MHNQLSRKDVSQRASHPLRNQANILPFPSYASLSSWTLAIFSPPVFLFPFLFFYLGIAVTPHREDAFHHYPKDITPFGRWQDA
jgi:hypothetical protein